MSLTTAIFGLGNIGIKYDLDLDLNWKPNQVMTHCRAISESKYFSLKYLIDSNINSLELASSLFPDTPCLIESDALRLPSPEFVIVSVPTKFHLATVKKICENWRPMFLLIEKPFGMNSREAQAMDGLLSSANVMTFINYFRRYLPHICELKESHILQNFGKVLSIRISAYGSLTNVFSHFLDLGIFLLDYECFDILPKEILFQNKERIIFRNRENGVKFDFSGMGTLQLKREMTIEFEKFILVVSDNGQTLGIYDADFTLLREFKCSTNDFMSYQAVVLAFIDNSSRLNLEESSVKDVIHVHKFIESIGLLHA